MSIGKGRVRGREREGMGDDFRNSHFMEHGHWATPPELILTHFKLALTPLK
jgi:hypothetical protein